MKIAVVGTGYVGLVAGTCFADSGNIVTCVDVDTAKVSRLKDGQIPIFEPGLEALFERNIKQGRLLFTTSLADGIEGAKIIFLALPTPSGADGAADLSAVRKVASELSKLIKTYTVIVNKSTVPVGTAHIVHTILSENLKEDVFDVVSNPEFLREGVAVDDFLKPDRIIIGTSSPRAEELMRQLYNPFVRQGNPVIVMDERSAEMTKYAANAYLAARISFMNEIANLCELLGADVDQVRKGMGSDSRIGRRFLFPGVGFGGSCFPKDVRALATTARENDYDFKILKAVMHVNDLQKDILSTKISRYFDDNLKGKTIAVWGLAFKPNTDDIREAPALTILARLLNKGVRIKAYDPEAMENVRQVFGDKIEYSTSEYEAIQDADALAIVTEWNEFRNPDFDHMKKIMKAPVIFDGRNIYDVKVTRDKGFYYDSIGR
ncbi:MAG TPA: UDP-glucose/GDP-mannose dehydrogenase family protein [Saprospiraceae bacterium]|nr:UDP-glucose/GDP-mannose dehydrogenase family protein [Saprospiraceae bacterium]HRO08539.1 UDP-glucose/GDP-mannose dehydrogenase family protein [Saprospiraceae bacterium]HRP41925.1 UDP-glucose/GDP-mannose dehydrogenase family protein [Saprospiraceae bacterium]